VAIVGKERGRDDVARIGRRYGPYLFILYRAI
jgi:hypothetical protein